MILDNIVITCRNFKEPLFRENYQNLKDFDIITPISSFQTHDLYYFNLMSYETQLSPKIIESFRNEVDTNIFFSGN